MLYLSFMSKVYTYVFYLPSIVASMKVFEMDPTIVLLLAAVVNIMLTLVIGKKEEEWWTHNYNRLTQAPLVIERNCELLA